MDTDAGPLSRDLVRAVELLSDVFTSTTRKKTLADAGSIE
jgi:hypothetical protein